jgi:hypothetical protein
MLLSISKNLSLIETKSLNVTPNRLALIAARANSSAAPAYAV